MSPSGDINNSYKLKGNERRHYPCPPIRVAFSQQATDTIDWTVRCDWLQPASGKNFLHNTVHARYHVNEVCKTSASLVWCLAGFPASLRVVSFNFYHSCGMGLTDVCCGCDCSFWGNSLLTRSYRACWTSMIWCHGRRACTVFSAALPPTSRRNVSAVSPHRRRGVTRCKSTLRSSSSFRSASASICEK